MNGKELKSSIKSIFRSVYPTSAHPVYSAIYSQRYKFILAMLMSVIVVVITLLLPQLVSKIIDSFSKGGAWPRSWSRDAGFFIGSVVILAVSYVMMNKLTVRLINEVVFALRQSAYAKLFKCPLLRLDQFSAGEMVSRLINDLNNIKDGFSTGAIQAAGNVIAIFGALYLIFDLSYMAGVAVLAMTPFCFTITYNLARRARRYFKAQQEITSEMTALLQENLLNADIMRALHRKEKFLADYEALNDRLEVVGRQAQFTASLTNPATRYVNNLLYVVIALIAAKLGSDGRLSYGAITALISYTLIYVAPINQLGAILGEIQKAVTAARRLADFICLPEESVTEGEMLTWQGGKVEFENVSFSYSPDKSFYQNFNLTVMLGETVAIVGPTGGGKTTLVNLLMRFYPCQSGRICLDGQDINKVAKDTYYHTVGMVLQDTWLFNDTVAANIAYGSERATPAEVEAAARTACADSFIRQMPQGYATLLNQSGGNLSQGQRQLLTIARVVLLRPRVLILDEATSNVDVTTEQMVQAALQTIQEHCTTFVIAHRLSTIREADRIIYIDNGKILESGNHIELMAKHGCYYRMYMSQYV